MLYLEPFETDYLLHVLDGKPYVYSDEKPDFLAKKFIISKLKSDVERLKTIHDCAHEYGDYIGHKRSCKFCDSFDVGMGISWELVD
jgi:hypothetical protein